MINQKNTFQITDEQLEELILKVENKIRNILINEGQSTKTTVINNSVSDTIRNYLKKNCL